MKPVQMLLQEALEKYGLEKLIGCEIKLISGHVSHTRSKIGQSYIIVKEYNSEHLAGANPDKVTRSGLPTGVVGEMDRLYGTSWAAIPKNAQVEFIPPVTDQTKQRRRMVAIALMLGSR